MGDRRRQAAYTTLWIFALAFGWIEASVVVYLREVYARTVSLQPTTFEGLQVTFVSLPGHLVALEMAREACTMLLLGSVAWLAGLRPADRAGAFLLVFGIWDLTYYAALKLVLGWPDSLSTWDILFLIPSPWVAPVWAPATIATLLVAAGTFLFWTPARERRYRWTDIAVLTTAATLTIAAFLVESSAAIDHRVPERFPLWLYWGGVALGATWFASVERRAKARTDAWRPWVGVRVRTILPDASAVTMEVSRPVAGGGVVSREREAEMFRLMWEYAEAKRKLDALMSEFGGLGEPLERLDRKPGEA